MKHGKIDNYSHSSSEGNGEIFSDGVEALYIEGEYTEE